ncbi:MAG: nucleotide pyrophosphohydrolase [Desulfotalea sp.]|nr:MAG: nucleotide pyrophosphohydrolase [Desulfotalea sp.]
MQNLQQEIKDFIRARAWEQHHNPKNLAMALSVETSELVEIFQWLTPKESSDLKAEDLTHLEEEIGDIMIYLTTLAAAYDLDPITAARKKIVKNALKYPLPEKCVRHGEIPLTSR